MGLLADLMSAADSSKRYIKGLLTDPSGTLHAWADRNIQAYTQPMLNAWSDRNTQADTKPYGDEMISNYLGAGVTPVGLLGKIVYHGSPHKFGKFDMSKIGTGEGAQAYGHGLYFAESPDVAKSYLPELDINQARELISQQMLDKNIKYGLRVLPDNANVGDKLNKSYRWIDGNFTGKPLRGTSVAAIKNGDIDSALNNLGMYIDRGRNGFYFGDEVALVGGIRPKVGQDYGEWTLQDARVLAKYMKKNVGKSNLVGGNLYKVDIPDEAVSRMLDWDKPLSEQTPEVQSALQSNPNYEKYWLPHMESAANRKGTNPGGDSLIRYLQDDFDPQEIADLLHSQGIKGIRYLDGGSRTSGNGTSNYVLFDDQLPRILERNGVPTGMQPWQSGEYERLIAEMMKK